MAAQKRAKIMAQMLAMQNNFMKENAKMFEDADTSTYHSFNIHTSICLFYSNN